MIDFDIQRFEDIKNSTNYMTVTGTADNDDILNYGSHVTIIGFGGNDSIVTFNTSYVSISGGAGDDTVINRNYNLVGNFYEYNNGDGNDVIVNLKSNDYLIINGNRREITRENDGDIVIEVGSNSITIQKYTIVDYYKNNTTITGTAYSDNIEHFNGSNVTIIGGDGNDNLQNFYSENVTMSGGAGDDTLINLSPNVSMSGGDGNDFIEILDVNVTINGGAGNDTIIKYDYDSIGNIYEYNNGDGNDIITGLNSNDSLIINGTTYSQQVSGNDFIINAGNGSITLKDSASISPVILNPSSSSPVVKSGNVYTYNGGSGTIENYTPGEQINLASDFTGINVDENNFYVNSSSGTLAIQNARDKVISYGASDGNLIAYSFMAGGGGDIDGRNIPQYEIIIGANNSNNQIFAGSGGSNMWSGAGGNDTLVGGAGYDEFIFGLGSGGDVIQNAGDNDLINLSGVTLNQITGLSASESSVNISLSDGSYLNVEGNSKVGYKIENAVFACDQSTGNWYAK